MMPQDFSGGDERGGRVLFLEGLETRTVRALERVHVEVERLRQAYETTAVAQRGERERLRGAAAHGRDLLSSRYHRRHG